MVSDAREQAEWPTEGRGRPRRLRAGGEASEKTGVSDAREQAEWPTALAARNWYERELGWATADGPALRLRTGLRFDVLEVPTAAGMAVLRRMRRTGPVACAGDRVVLLVAAGSAEEVPGLLDWLEWGGIELDLRAHGAGGCIPAPLPPDAPPSPSPPASPSPQTEREAAYSRQGPVWLRPPESGREVEPTLPALTWSSDRSGSRGGAHGPVGLAPLLGALATECHRARLFPTCAVPTQWPALSSDRRDRRDRSDLLDPSDQACAFS